jgi:hypothetical protein
MSRLIPATVNVLFDHRARSQATAIMWNIAVTMIRKRSPLSLGARSHPRFLKLILRTFRGRLSPPEQLGTPIKTRTYYQLGKPSAKGAEQLAQVCEYLQHRPIALFDSEYGCAPLVKATAAIAADKLMRIRSNRCLWSAPLSYLGG